MEKKGLSFNLLLGLFFLYPFFPLIKEWNDSAGTILEFAFVIILILFSVLDYKGQNIDFSSTGTEMFSILFIFCYYVIGVINGLESPISGIRCFLLYIFLYSCLQSEKIKRTELNLFAKAIILGSVISGVGAVIQYIRPELITALHTEEMLISLRYKSDYTAFSQYNRAFSFFNDPNLLGVYMFFSFVLYMRYNEWRQQKKKSTYIIYILFLVTIMLSRSRTAIFTTLIYFVVSTIRDFFRKGISPRKMFVVTAVMFFGTFFVVSSWDEILGFLRMDTLATAGGRFIKNDQNIDFLLERDILKFLFGNGLFDGREIIYENSFLTVMYMFGCLGMIIFYLLIVSIFKSGKCEKNVTPLICYLLISYVGDYILIPQISYIFIFLYAFNSKITTFSLREV